jgi:hypothetical protein
MSQLKEGKGLKDVLFNRLSAAGVVSNAIKDKCAWAMDEAPSFQF